MDSIEENLKTLTADVQREAKKIYGKPRNIGFIILLVIIAIVVIILIYLLWAKNKK